MKRCVLQASPGGGRETERFVAQCDRIDHVVGKRLVIPDRDTEDGTIWLCKQTNGGMEKTAACIVVSRSPTEDNMFPTVFLPSGEVCRLAGMRNYEVELLEFAEDSESERQEGAGGAEALIKDIISGERISDMMAQYEDATEDDGQPPRWKSDANKMLEKESSMEREEEAMRKMSLKDDKTGSDSSWEGMESSPSYKTGFTSSGGESAVLVGQRSKSSESPSDSSGVGSYVDASNVPLNPLSRGSPPSTTTKGTAFNFGIDTEITGEGSILDKDGFIVRANDTSIEVSSQHSRVQPQKPSYRDVAAPFDERDSQSKNRQYGSKGISSMRYDHPLSESETKPTQSTNSNAAGESHVNPMLDEDVDPFDDDKKQSFLSYAWKTFTGQKPAAEKKKPATEAPKTWTNYSHLAIVINRAVNDDNKKRLVNASTSVKSFLSSKEVSIQVLTLGAFMCNLNWGDETSEHRALILQRLSSISLSEDQLGLSTVKGNFLEADVRPHRVWYEFFANLVDGKALLSQQPKDNALVNMFWVWIDCGLFRRKYNADLWQAVRGSVDASFFSRRHLLLTQKIGAEHTQSIEALLQSNLNDLAALVMQLQGSKHGAPLHVNSHFADHLVGLVKRDVSLAAPASESLAPLWDVLFATLSCVKFPKQAIPSVIIKASISAISFRSLRTFHRYEELVAALGTDNKYNATVKSLIRESLCTDLASSRKEISLSIHDVMGLMASQIAPYLSPSGGVEALKKFSKEAMRSLSPFDLKLRFIGEVFKFLSSIRTVSVQGSKKFVVDCIRIANEKVGASYRLQTAFSVASDQPSIFCHDTDDTLLIQVSKLLCSDTECRALLNEPELILRLPLGDNSSARTSLCGCLMDQLQETLELECLEPETACRLFLAATSFREGSPPCSVHVGLATDVFSAFFSKWSPTDVNDFLSLSYSTLDLLYKCFDVSSESESMPRSDSKRMEQCRERVRLVVSTWSTDYDNEVLTKSYFDRVLEQDNRCLQLLATIAQAELPKMSHIRAKSQACAELTNTITQLLQGSEDTVSLEAIFNGYNCDVYPASSLHRLLTRYGWLEESRGGFSERNGPSMEPLLCHLRVDAAAGLDFYKTNSESLMICDFFLRTPSVLFPSFLRDELKGSVTMESLSRATQDAKASLLKLVNPDSDYSIIRHAVSTITAGGSTVDHETSVLLGCGELELSTEHMDSFLIVAALAEITESLQRFVDCCRQFKFAVTSDPAFEELSSVIQEISGNTAGSPSMQDCLTASDRMCSILPVDTAGSGDSLPDIRSVAREHLPALSLLGHFSLNSEVWSFVREMNWFGREGLKQFYEQYSNVTNVLLGNTASYEMSVLSAVEPTVRVVSAVGGLHQEPTVADLLNELQAHKDVIAFIESGAGPADIVQVQTNLSQIRDWFTVGVDEIAAVHVTFDVVCKSGEYCLLPTEPNQAAPPSGMPDGNEKPVLTLRYTAKEKARTLQDEDLNSFIQHVGLLQHENESTAASVSAFVEQYQILSTAAGNIMYMDSIGFSESGRDTFSCMVGDRHIGHARKLLSDSEAATRTCQAWLKMTRSTHYVSLLFWTDELLEIHELVKQAVDAMDVEEDPIVRKLANMLTRLSRGSVSFAQLLVVVTDAIEARKQDQGRQEFSWLVDVSMFLDSVHRTLSAPWEQAVNESKGQSRIVLHTLACTSAEFLELSLRVLQDVYKHRLPEEFEVLDGLVDGTREKLSVFLNRVKTFRSGTFAILNIEALDGSLLEVILSFLSDSSISGEGIRLHLIQKEGSMLHSSPWIHGVRWETDELSANDESDWKTLILSQIDINEVSVVWSPESGAGKSRYIQQKLSDGAVNDSTVESAKVTVHERSTIKSLTQHLATKFSQGTGAKAVHLNLAYLPTMTGDDESVRWVASLHRFFFSLMVLRFVRDSESALSFHLGEANWRIYVEFPNLGSDNSTINSVTAWLQRHVPVLYLCCTLETPPTRLAIDPETRRVCTYLRAYEDGTIDRKFEPRTHRGLVLVFDRSGSMGWDFGNATALSVATDNALRIFDSHVGVGDTFGVILFDNTTENWIPAQIVVDENHRLRLREAVDQVRNLVRGGTCMYAALQYAFEAVANDDAQLETWVVCLTDGASADSDEALRPWVEQSRENVHLIVIGVNLASKFEQYMQFMCSKYGRLQTEPNKGFFIRSEATANSMNSAFATVSRSIPVSETFDLDGAVSDEQCLVLLDSYAPDFVDRQDMLLMSFWVQFIHRRVKVFDENESFNYNETHESLGSTLMRTMLEEVERLLSTNHSRDWVGKDHTQLIYDFTREDSPEFRLLCTSPDEMDEDTRRQLDQLDLPGFAIPSSRELQQRGTLDRFLSQALNLPLRDGRLACIDKNNFILTLDFTMKLLSIHERVACRTPCVIEGETGVSKTALTRMYAILRNSVIVDEAKQRTRQHLDEIAQELVGAGHHVPNPQKRLEEALVEASESVIGTETDIARDLCNAIRTKCDTRPALFQEVPREYTDDGEARTNVAKAFLSWFSNAALEPTFFDVNVDSSLNEQDFVERFVPIRKAAQKLLGSDAMVVVFLDEFNTSSVLGLCKEIIVDHTLAGQRLEDSIVVISACNPARKLVTAANTRERDLGKEWAGGHYQVAGLPPAVAKIKWSFGSLNHDQEKDFVLRRMELVGSGEESLPTYLRVALTEFISESQEAMRSFAARNIRDSLVRAKGEMGEEVDSLAVLRARSVVSLRDIQRVFSLFDFFVSDVKLSCVVAGSIAQTHRNAMLLAIATVYYLRLDTVSREEFLNMTRSLPAERHEKTDLLDVLNSAMDEVIHETEISGGVAITRGLRENVFVTFVCTLSRTPLMIVGPPGSSKTLSVNIVSDNCNGEDSASIFYRKHARLALFHYQCSKQSTSKELLSVFDKAIQRQQRVDSAKHRCFVLMDEAGLPEEEKESLKVLHYLLEGHMSAKSEVGFVAISNHVLDAAKTNRCVMLLREEPDEDDMLSIARGVLFDVGEDGYGRANHVDLEGTSFPANDFALSLCQSYSMLLHDDNELSWFDTFFGLRDFLHFLRALRARASFESMKMGIVFQDIVYALERNFNGVSHYEILLIAERFLKPLVESKAAWSAKLLEGAFRDPVHVIRDALSSSNGVSRLLDSTRFKLIIDCSGDDSILRLLRIGGIVDVSKRSMFKLSRMPQEVALEELRLISGVKFAALQGNTAILSQTESINESFYDLFNQRFQAVTGRDGQVDLYSNIAVGGISRRSLVRPEFECIVHVNESDLHRMPAPFLNRFEKFRLSINDVLHSGWENLGAFAAVFEQSRQSTSMLASVLDENGTIGWVGDSQLLIVCLSTCCPLRYRAEKLRWKLTKPSLVSTWIRTVQILQTL